MGISGKVAAAVLLVALVVGFLVAKRHDLFPGDTSRGPAVHPTAPAPTTGGQVRSSVRVRELRILGADESVGVRLGESSEAGPGIWMTNARKSAVVEMGVHGNGFPFLLVSDGAIRNFGLGRVDGPEASPFLVFRTDDVVRMVFGLSVTEPPQPPFLVQYTADGQKHDVVGHYCDRPDRVCVR
jgi:hypothetical protein